MKITKYKKIFRELGVSHRILSLYTSYSRENLTLYFLGKSIPTKKAKHLIKEFKEIIALRKNEIFKNKKEFNKFIEMTCN